VNKSAGCLTPKIPARAATLAEIHKHTAPLFICPVPHKATLRLWFDQARVQRFKANQLAKRGGGPVYYSLADVEKLFRSRTLPGRTSQLLSLK
jgi:hypothetical protein